MRLLYAIKKEFLEIMHDRTMLLVLALFPVFIMLFMGSSFGSVQINGLPVGIVGPTNTTFTSVLFEGLNQSQQKLYTRLLSVLKLLKGIYYKFPLRHDILRFNGDVHIS